jgi:hypothetical protein
LGEVLGNFGELLDGCNPVAGLAMDPGVLVGGFTNETSKVTRPGHDCKVEVGKGFFGSGDIVGVMRILLEGSGKYPCLGPFTWRLSKYL